MEPTAITVVSQLINEGRVRFGDLDAVEVPRELLDECMDEVAAAGGEVGFDHAVVDGFVVRPLPEGTAAQAAFVVAASGARETLDREE